MNAEYFEVKSKNNILRGMRHISDLDSDVSVLIVHGYFSSNKIGPHRLYVEIANTIANKYCDAYRFDLSGMGESDGNIADVKFKDHVDDLECVIDYLYSKGIKKLAIIGHCIGADLVLEILKKEKYKFREIILLAPYFTNPSSLKLFFKEPNQIENLYLYGHTNRNGLYVDRSFFLEATFFENFLTSINASNSFINVVAARNDQFIPFEENEKIRNGAQRINFVYIPDADHNFLKVRKELLDTICRIFEDGNFTEID